MTVAEDLDARIAEATATLRERDRLASRSADLDRTLAEHERAISALVATLGHEERDVARLEGLTLGRVLAALRGSREDDLARERAERDAASYRLAEERGRRDLVLRERAVLVDRRSALGSADVQLAEALAAKEEYLRTVPGDAVAGQLFALAAERGTLTAELREVDEALAAAHGAGAALDQVQQHLGSAHSWSTYDTWLGGGAISGMVKHDRLDQAQQAAARAEGRLAALRRELADVGGGSGQIVPALGVDGLTRFLDIWFDNVFTDFSVASRINRAREQTEEVGRAVTAVVEHLRERQAALRARLDELDRRRAQLLSPA